MKVFLNRDSAVSLQEQLASQIGQMVASGDLAQGSRLPSIRALAKRLNVHHNTVMAAYQRLEALGVIDVRKGSGTHVVDHQKNTPHANLASLEWLARRFVEHARTGGHTYTAIQTAVDVALGQPSFERLAAVNPHDDLLRIYVHELTDALDTSVVGMTLEAIEKLSPHERAKTLFLTSSNHATSLKGKLGDANEVILMQLASVSPLLDWARAISSDGLLGIASMSVRFRVLFREILAAICSDDTMIDVPLEDGVWVPGTLNLTTHVLTDALSATVLQRHSSVTPFVFRLIGKEAINELGHRLQSRTLRE